MLLLLARSCTRRGRQRLGFGIGESRARMYTEERQTSPFADVASNEEAKEDLRRSSITFGSPSLRKVGARIPHGVLLSGPPGTGKTLWRARSQARRRFRSSSVSATEFVTCSSASAPLGFATSSRRRRRLRRASPS